MSDTFPAPSISDNDYQVVEQLLGRPPRGLMAIPVRGKQTEPVVIQVASLVDNKPFPTLFWLVDPALSYAMDQLEARGFIADLQQRIDASQALQQSMAEDHRQHIALRRSLMPEAIYTQIQALGFEAVFERRGIGGIENFTRIRCLHTYYAAHLVAPNTVGKLLDEYWAATEVHFYHLK